MSEYPLPRDDDHLRAGAVPVRFLIGAGFDRHDVTDHGVPGKMNAQAAETDAALGMGIEVTAVKIRNKIDHAVFLFAWLQVAAEKILSVRRNDQ